MASGARDYVAAADAYAAKAIADKGGKSFGKWMRKAAKRYVADRKHARTKSPRFTFDPWHANDACDFIEKLPHVEGTWDTPNIVLHESHVFFLVNLFGFRSGLARRFSVALFAVARKNAKSTLAAAILLYCFCCEADNGPQVITAATTGPQARVVFGIARRMVEKTPDLREAFDLGPFANAIARTEVGGTFKPINAKASTQDGLNPSVVALDEIHAHKTHDLLNVLQSAAGARANPLFLYTTTEGYENPGPWGELRHFATQILNGVIEADHFLVLYYAIDDKDSEFDESKWVKANPLIDVNPKLRPEIRKAAIEAKGMPGQLAEFRIKKVNRRSSSANIWIDLPAWLRCAGPVDLEMLSKHQCWGGLDLASTRDLTAFRLVWRVDGVYYTWGKRWVPKGAVAQRTERGSVPYAAWVTAGHVTQTEGEVVDYDVIRADILAIRDRFNPTMIAYDRWNATDIVRRLVADNVPMVEFIQGPKSYHPAMQEFERAYMGGNFRYGADPVLTWCASNLVPRYDQNLNMATDKKKSADKIDDMAAMLMAIGLAVGMESETSPYSSRGLVIL